MVDAGPPGPFDTPTESGEPSPPKSSSGIWLAVHEPLIVVLGRSEVPVSWRDARASRTRASARRTS
jgi:hypothetical protein